jgi:hypothetical protein
MGIDYGRGKTNIDLLTGIRYGVISVRKLDLDIFDAFTSHPVCPHCGTDLPDTFDPYESDCPHCGACIEDGEQWPEDVESYYSKNGITAVYSPDTGDVTFLKSPYTVKGPYCSPCAPGAISIGLEGEDDVGYAPPPEWLAEDVTLKYVAYNAEECDWLEVKG